MVPLLYLFFLLTLQKNLIDSVPTWEELDRIPLPTWYADAKFGIFVHWGVFSVPSFGSEWFQYYWLNEQNPQYEAFINDTERPGFAYTEYATRFHAPLYQPDHWARTFANAGAQYVVVTSKHHDGYCLWDSRSIPTTWQWNVMDVGPRRDVLGELAVAVRHTTSPLTHQRMQFGVYHSLYEWFNPLYLQDKANNFTTSAFVDHKILPELYDLVQKYQPTLLWSDGQWEAHSDYWKAREFLDWYSTQSPDNNLWNDRWGSDTMCQHGSFLTCSDRYHPDKAMSRKWEKCLSMDTTSWGYSRISNLEAYLTTKELIHELIVTVAQNGNLLLNIGPASDGRLPTIFEDRLRDMGDWLKVNGEAIYGTSTWSTCTNDTTTGSVYYTHKGDTVYAHVTDWPSSQRLVLSCLALHTPRTIHMLGLPNVELDWTMDATKSLLNVHLPLLTPDKVPCAHAWVLTVDTDDGTKEAALRTDALHK